MREETQVQRGFGLASLPFPSRCRSPSLYLPAHLSFLKRGCSAASGQGAGTAGNETDFPLRHPNPSFAAAGTQVV